MLDRHFDDVWLGGIDAAPHVKADFEARRIKGNKLLKLDVFDLRHRMPHSWYVWAYTRLLPLVYKVFARGDTRRRSPASRPTTGSSPTSPTTRRSCSSPWPAPRRQRPQPTRRNGAA